MAKKRANKNRSARERLRKEKQEKIKQEREQNELFSWMFKAIMFVVAYAFAHFAALIFLKSIPADSIFIVFAIVGMVLYGTYCLVTFISNKDKDCRNLSIELFICAVILIFMRAYLLQ